MFSTIFGLQTPRKCYFNGISQHVYTGNLQQSHGKLSHPVSRVDYYPCQCLLMLWHTSATCACHHCHLLRAFDVPLLVPFSQLAETERINPALLRTPKHHWLPDSNLSAVPWGVDQAWRIPTSCWFQGHFLSQYLTNPLVCLSLFPSIHICCGYHKSICFVAIPLAAVFVVVGFPP